VRRQTRLSVGAAATLGVRVVNLVTMAATTFALARLLGPADLGVYYLLALVPPSTLALLSFGIPASLTYHAGRGEELSEIRSLALVLAIGTSAAIVCALLILRPVLATTVLAAAPTELFPIAALAVPGMFIASFCNSVILGRQSLRAFNLLLAAQGTSLFVAELVVVGLLGAGLVGAIVTYVVVMAGSGVASAVAMIRLAPFRPQLSRATARRVLRFGIVLHPASLAGFFSYRADVFLMSALLRDPSALGVYGLAVNVAELCFFVADATSTVLFPRIAASDRRDAAVIVPAISRTAMALTGAGALGLAALSVVAIPLVLPTYARSVPPILILLPGVVALSASKVLSGYLSGIGRPGPISAVASMTLVLNIVANLALIPILGPVGAAISSLVSYSVNGGLMVKLGARQAGVGVRAMIVPRLADLARLRQLVTTPLHSR
jgi:O-antigen/teichoic acid export membrane protein